MRPSTQNQKLYILFIASDYSLIRIRDTDKNHTNKVRRIKYTHKKKRSQIKTTRFVYQMEDDIL